MALQAATFLPSALSIHKEGKSSAALRESAAFGISLSKSLKNDFVSPSNWSKDCKKRLVVRTIRAQTVSSPSTIQTTTGGKKTLRKGNVVITGASSGLGLATAKALAETGEWHVTMACRNFLKAEKAAKSVGIAKENYTVMHLDLASLESVRQFVENFRLSGKPLDVLVCNAAVYFPTAKEPTFSAEGFELSVGTNHLGHFLLSRLLLDDLKKSDYPQKRLIIVGSITGNTNTLAGNVPPKANLGDLRGLAGGLNGLDSSPMIDGGEFDGAKAYKDSKVCNMLTMQEFHRRYHEETGIAFASLYPGCIAETGLFREHIPLFKLLFPPFQKYITKGYVSEDVAGKRLAQVVSDPSLSKSGVYWSWNNNSSSFVNQLSKEASDAEKARKLWESKHRSNSSRASQGEMDKIQHDYVEVRGLKLHLAQIGTGQEVVFFLHGFPEIWYSWRHQMIAVAEAGFRAIAPDFRGYGLSEIPAQPDKTTFKDLINDLLGILDFYGFQKVFLVGKDFGGRVAHHFTVVHKERVSAVITLGVPFLPPGPGLLPNNLPQGFYMLRWREPRRAERDFGRFPVKTVVKNIYILFSGSELPVANDEEEIMDLVDPSTPLPSWFTEEDLDNYTKLYENSGFQTALQIPYRGWLEDYGVDDPKVKVPSLLIMGEKDYAFKFGGLGEYIKSGIVKDYVPDLEVIFIPEGTHFVQEQFPDKVNNFIIAYLHKHV